MMFTGNNQPSAMNPQQQEKLQTIGAQIRQIRKQKSISIDEVETKTRIQARLLGAIEQGNLDELPEPVYIKGLIKQFADAVGLDGTEYAQQFPTESQADNVKPSWQQSPTPVLRPLHLYLIYLVLVIISIAGISYLVDYKLSQQQTQQQDSLSNETSAATSTSNSELAETDPSQTSESSSQQPVQVKVSIQEDTWLEVIRDGEQVYKGTLAAGKTQTWTAQEDLTLRTKDGGSMVVEYHHQKTTQVRQFGELKEVTYAPSNQ